MRSEGEGEPPGPALLPLSDSSLSWPLQVMQAQCLLPSMPQVPAPPSGRSHPIRALSPVAAEGQGRASGKAPCSLGDGAGAPCRLPISQQSVEPCSRGQYPIPSARDTHLRRLLLWTWRSLRTEGELPPGPRLDSGPPTVATPSPERVPRGPPCCPPHGGPGSTPRGHSSPLSHISQNRSFKN